MKWRTAAVSVLAILSLSVVQGAVLGQHAPPGQAASVTFYTCPMHPEVTASWEAKCPKCGMSLAKRKAPEHRPATVYTCSMHPQISVPKPGKCPICGMTLIETKNAGHAAEATPQAKLQMVHKMQKLGMQIMAHDPAVLLSLKNALRLTEAQTHHLDVLAERTRQQAAHLLTDEQRQHLHRLGAEHQATETHDEHGEMHGKGHGHTTHH